MHIESVQDKAARFLNEGRLDPYVATEAFAVQGDSDTYMVVVGPDVWFCSCPATVKCSHVLAAEQWYRAERDAMAGDERAALELSGYVRHRADRYHAEGVGA